jgi:hypothetical protein
MIISLMARLWIDLHIDEQAGRQAGRQAGLPQCVHLLFYTPNGDVWYLKKRPDSANAPGSDSDGIDWCVQPLLTDLIFLILHLILFKRRLLLISHFVH